MSDQTQDPFEHATGAPCSDPWCEDKAAADPRHRVRDLIAAKLDEKLRSERLDDHFDGQDYAEAVMELFPDVRELGEHHGAGIIVPVPSHLPGGMVVTHTRLMLSTAPRPVEREG